MKCLVIPKVYKLILGVNFGLNDSFSKKYIWFKETNLHSLKAVGHFMPCIVNHFVKVLQGVNLKRWLRVVKV